MTALLLLIFLALALAAAAFVAVPAIRFGVAGGKWKRLAAASLAGVAVLLTGLGGYALVGRPDFALRTLTGPDNTDYADMIARLSRIIRDHPDDPQGWSILGRGYLAFGETDQAVKALGRALALARAGPGGAPANLLADYAVALSVQQGGVTPETEGFFREAIAADPANPEARYYLGLAHATRGEDELALGYWRSLLAEAPPDAPWREELLARVAALSGGAGMPAPEAPPNIAAMVEGLAARLDVNPGDLEGWLMLIRAYGVLGQADQARAALARARDVFAGNADAENAISAQARASRLE